LYSQNTTHMTTTTTPSVIKMNPTESSNSIFYGSVRINANSVCVSNLTELGETYHFRYTSKVRAGFPSICDVVCTIDALPYYLSKNTTVVQIERLINGESHWFHVLTTKGGKWSSIDKNLLESLTVGDMHRAFPKMIDWNIWKLMNTKLHGCKSFVYNEDPSQN
jgi:hypothetical protein